MRSLGNLLTTRLRPFALLALAAFLAAAVPASARSLSGAETTSLAETVARFDAAMKANDFAAVSRTIPPKILQHIAAKAGISVDDLRDVVVQQMSQTLNDVKLVSFGMDLDKAIPKELPDGTPFLLIPTETVIDVGGGEKTAVRSHTLALLDGAEWFLLRVSDEAQVAILKQVYPGFAGETFPGGTSEAVK